MLDQEARRPDGAPDGPDDGSDAAGSNGDRAAHNANGDLSSARLAVQLAALALDGYVEAAKGAIQLLGGMGFTWEHDAHIHLRRSTTLRQIVGGTAPLRAGASRLALAGRRRRLSLELPPEAELLRRELTPIVEVHRRRRGSRLEQRRALADEGC